MREVAEKSSVLLERLKCVLQPVDRLAVAISGGVDSTTLATVAHLALGERALMIHAVSPAVPPEATDRVRYHAEMFGWPLEIIDAGEFADSKYISNPVDRCYFCKSNLYSRIRQRWKGTVASGANLDDLGDYRPGLLAAERNTVIHPLIQADMDKAAVRQLAAFLKLDEVAELPAQPCLSSRVETGIAINADDLHFIHFIERQLLEVLGAGDVRCRVTAQGVRIEIGRDLKHVNTANWPKLEEWMSQLVRDNNRALVEITDYQKGSAFIAPPGRPSPLGEIPLSVASQTWTPALPMQKSKKP